MADWNDPTSALSGEEEVGSTLEAMVKFYCFHVSPKNEVFTFLFGVQSVESATDLMKRANTLLNRCQSISPHLLPSHGNRMLYFFSAWLECDMKKDITPDIKSRMALMINLYEESCDQAERETQRVGGIVKAGCESKSAEEIMKLLRDLKRPEVSLTLRSKPRGNLKDISTYSNPKSITAIAESLTLLATMTYKTLTPSDFFLDKSPRLTLLANIFDRVSYWVATSIVKSSHPAKAITFFILLGSELMKMANYDILLAVLTGLGNIAITRLSTIWEGVSPKKVEKFKKLEDFMGPAGGYKNYRTKLRDHPQGKPCVPYVALCLRDLTYIRDGAPTWLENTTSEGSDHSQSSDKAEAEAKKPLLNVRKIHLIGKCIMEYFDKMNLDYDLQQPEMEIFEQIRNVQGMDDDQLFSASLKMQPPPVDYDCFQLNPDFFSTVIIEKGIDKDLANALAEKLSELSLEELAALDRKSIKQLGVTKLKDTVTVLNAIHTAIGVPPFLLQPAHTWTADDVIEWATLSEFDKSIVKKLKEKKIDGNGVLALTPEKVKELTSEKHRAAFRDGLSELQESGLAISLRKKLQTKMKKDQVAKNFAPAADSSTGSESLPPSSAEEAVRRGSSSSTPLAAQRNLISEESNTCSSASEDCLTDDTGEGSLSFIHLDENKKQIAKATISYSADSATLFKMRFFCKKKFKIKPSFYGVADDGTYFALGNEAEMAKWLSTCKPKRVYICQGRLR